jgi:hypothetical protein
MKLSNFVEFIDYDSLEQARSRLLDAIYEDNVTIDGLVNWMVFAVNETPNKDPHLSFNPPSRETLHGFILTWISAQPEDARRYVEDISMILGDIRPLSALINVAKKLDISTPPAFPSQSLQRVRNPSGQHRLS